MPIVQSTTYRFDSCDHVAALFDKPTEFMYSRFANPTCDAVEKKIADMEGGVGCMLTSSGQAATLCSILNLCSAGDSFIASSSIYGGTINLFGFTLKKLGIECIWVDVNASYDEIVKAFKPNTKCVFGETIANPALTVFDFEKWAKAGSLAVEMEAAALYLNAMHLKKRALAICTISDLPFTGEACTAEERQNTFTDMMKIALEATVRLDK